MLSVLTLVRGRDRHLANVIRGLEANTALPAEFIIVHMNEAAVGHQSTRFPIRSEVVRDSDTPLPLAAARNRAAAMAVGDAFVFLDVDCIPAPTLIAQYRSALLAHPDALHQGEVRYLPADTFVDAHSTAQALSKAKPHPLHTPYADGDALPYPLFWSLNFACLRTVFARIGGFDETYRGYGGEDTDFAFRAREAHIPLYRSDALVFHQYHASYAPPLNHFDSIIANARVFRTRWGHWPMEGWLHAFAQGGFVTFTEDALEVRRHPSAIEIAACITHPTTLVHD